MTSTPHPDNRTEELLSEQKLLSKAETDIEQGWTRLRKQQDLLSELQRGGRDTNEAERLVQLMKRTLVEWERHRRLIEQRVAYLEKDVSGP
jgi:predicted transcriptional regulator